MRYKQPSVQYLVRYRPIKSRHLNASVPVYIRVPKDNQSSPRKFTSADPAREYNHLILLHLVETLLHIVRDIEYGLYTPYIT